MTAALADDAMFLDFIEDGLVGLRGRDTAQQKTWTTPGQLAKDIDPATRHTPALELIDKALVDVDAGRCDRLIITMPPQEGKSTRVTKYGPLWMLTWNPQRRIVVVSYGQDLATEFGRDIRNMITSNQDEDASLDIGLRIARDNGSNSSWKLAGARGGVRSVGIGGGITGRPARGRDVHRRPDHQPRTGRLRDLPAACEEPLERLRQLGTRLSMDSGLTPTPR